MNSVSRSDFIAAITGKPQTQLLDVKDSSSAQQQPTVNTAVKPVSANPYTGVWGKEQVLHLVRRSLFGVTVADYTYFSKLTLEQCLDALLVQSPMPSPPVNTYNDSAKTDPDVPFGETWVNCPVANLGEIDIRRTRSLSAWWTGLIINQDRTLTEKMTLFWHNHLAANFNFISDSRAMYNYVTALRSRTLGNFKKLTFDITTSTGMLQYLGGYQSKASAPNENYGRELQELFTVGKGPGSHYTQDDVVTAARLLTGWTNDATGLKTIFEPTWHDTTDKQFSAFYNNRIIKGRSGAAGAEETSELIDMIFDTREVALHTCRCLYRWFINAPIDDNVETNFIEPLADILIKSEYEIIPVLRVMLESEHFFDSANMGCQVKNPVDFLIGLCRQFSVTSFPSDIGKQYKVWDAISRSLEPLAMAPGYPPSVAGWAAYYQSPGYYQLWINSATITKRFNLTGYLFSQWGLGYGDTYPNIRFDVIAFTAQLSEPSDVNQLVKDSVPLLSPVAFDGTEIAFLKTLLLSWPEGNHSWTPSVRTEISEMVTSEEAWHKLWTRYVAEPNNATVKNEVANRLGLYYTYLLQQAECHLI